MRRNKKKKQLRQKIAKEYDVEAKKNLQRMYSSFDKAEDIGIVKNIDREEKQNDK